MKLEKSNAQKMEAKFTSPIGQSNKCARKGNTNNRSDKAFVNGE